MRSASAPAALALKRLVTSRLPPPSPEPLEIPVPVSVVLPGSPRALGVLLEAVVLVAGQLRVVPLVRTPLVAGLVVVPARAPAKATAAAQTLATRLVRGKTLSG